MELSHLFWVYDPPFQVVLLVREPVRFKVGYFFNYLSDDNCATHIAASRSIHC